MIKKVLAIFLVCALVIGLLPAVPMAAVAAAGDVEIKEANFPDANFRKYVKETFDTGANGGKAGDGWLTAAEIGKIMQIDVAGYYDMPENEKIKSLKGVEYFTALEYLFCSYNQLTSLDVSKNTALTSLWCNGNQLKSLDVSKNTALTTLSCDNNQLTNLDVSKNTALEGLDCYNNQLTSLDVSKNTALTGLSCHRNQLTSLDVSKNTALTILSCGGNQLTNLDVSKNTELIALACHSNPLSKLDVSKNTALIGLYCIRNQLSELDVSKNTTLRFLKCESNKLSELDVSTNTALEELDCYGNKLTSLDVSKNTALKRLQCYDNKLTDLDLSQNKNLEILAIGKDAVKKYDLSRNGAMNTLSILNKMDLTEQADGTWQVDLSKLKDVATLPDGLIDISKLDDKMMFRYGDGLNNENIPNSKYDSSTGILTLQSKNDLLDANSDDWLNSALIVKFSNLRFNFALNIVPYGGVPTPAFFVSGEITSFGDPAAKTTVQLLQGNTKKHSVTGTSSYTIKNVAPGIYTLKVTKAGHAERTYTVTVKDKAERQDVAIYLLGDVDMNGKLNMLDIQKIFNFIKNADSITDEYQKKLADVDENKIYNMLDIQRLFNAIKKA